MGYVVAGAIVATSGGGGGGSTRPRLEITLGANSPTSTVALTVESDVEILQIHLASPGRDLQVTSIRFDASGSGDDSIGVAAVRLYRDVDGNGSLDPGDVELVAPAQYGSDDGSVTLTMTELLIKGEAVDWILVYDLSAGPQDNETFCAALPGAADVTADADGVAVKVTVGPGIQGCVTTTRTGLALSLGPNSPAPSLASPCATDHAILQVRLTAGPEDGVVVDSLTVTASGTGDDGVDVTAARLYVDIDGDGVGDSPLGTPGTYSGDDGTVTFSGLSRTIAASGTEDWVLACDLGGSIVVGRTFVCEIAQASDAAVRGESTAQPAPVTGAPVVSSVTTIDAPVLLSATYLDGNDNGLVDTGDTVTVVFDRAVTVQGTPLADDVFSLFDPSWSLGATSTVTPGGVAEEVEVVIDGASLQPNGTYPAAGSTGLDLDPVQTGLDDGGGCPVPPLGVPVDLQGELNPRVTQVTLGDRTGTCSAAAGDILRIRFTTEVTFLSAVPDDAFQLPVAGDTLGTGATFEGGGTPANLRTVTVRLGSAPNLRGLGVFGPGVTSPGSPSGLDVADTALAPVDAAWPGVSARPGVPVGQDIWSEAAKALWSSSVTGRSVASAGDLDGDGYDDVVVGDGLFTTLTDEEGRVVVHLGGPGGLSAAPVWESNGENQPYGTFGCSVAPVGDVDGDGNDDVIIGAYGMDTAASAAGKAYVYTGGSGGLSAVPLWESSGDDQGLAGFGGSVACAGDVNGDGMNDVIVGAAGFDTSNTDAGKAYLYLGVPGGVSTTPAWESSGDDRGFAAYGGCVASAGDVDGNGYDDVVVGAAYFDTANTDAGKVYLYLGGPGGLSTTPAWESSGDDQGGARFGTSVASAGDVDGNGYDDVVVGAAYFDAANTDAGKAYLYLGGPGGLSTTPAWDSSGDDQGSSWFGGSVSSAGDVDGDGYDDVVAGASGFDTANLYAGKAYLYLGGPGGLSTTPAWESSGEDRASALFGRAVAFAGDVDDDGYEDVIVGAGRTYVYRGGPTGLSSISGWESSGDDQGESWFGSSVSSAGDVDGDGYFDVIVGAREFDTANADAGKAYVYLGGPGGASVTPAWESSGDDQGNSWFGGSVSSAGDVDGDGYDDVVVGARYYSTVNTAAGKAYVYLGGPSGLAATPTWESSGDDQASAHFGNTVASAGDVNGDGYADIIVGAPGFSTPTTGAGKAYVYAGGPGGLSLLPLWVSSGEDQANAYFGTSVASAGDVNGDGYDEVIIGATGFGPPFTSIGKAYVYAGGSGGPAATPAWESSGDTQDSAYFGNCVASAGDVDGNGYDDVIVGSSQYDTGRLSAGKAYLFLGGPLGSLLNPGSAAEWTHSGDDQTSAFFGSSVASAGKVTGCCADLVIIGAAAFDTATTNEGKAYVICIAP